MKEQSVSLLSCHSTRVVCVNIELAEELDDWDGAAMLSQIAYLLGTKGKKQDDGRVWMHGSLSELQTYFPCWSRNTIDRVLKRLEQQQLVKFGNYEKRKHSKKRWVTLDEQGVNKLTSVSLQLCQNETSETLQNDTKTLQNDTDLFQNDTKTLQNDTTLREREEEKTLDFSSSPHDAASSASADASQNAASVEYIVDHASHWAVQMHHQAFRITLSVADQQRIAEEVTDSNNWEVAIQLWIGKGWNPHNIGNMLDRYHNLVNNDTPSTKKPPRAATSRSGTRRTKRDRNAEHAIRTPMPAPDYDSADECLRIAEKLYASQVGGQA